MSAKCAWTSGFNHELELDEFAGTAPLSPLIVGDSCPERTLIATSQADNPGNLGPRSLGCLWSSSLPDSAEQQSA